MRLPKISSLFAKPTKSTLRFSIKVALSALIALYLSKWMGLDAPFWAGISAVVVAGGSFGGSYLSGLNRAIATLVGLAVGLLFVAVMGPSVLTSGLAIVAGSIACEALRLKGGAKLGAGTTLIPTLVSSNAPLFASLERAGNVLLGCAVGVIINLLLWPEKALTKLDKVLRDNVIDIGRLLSKALRSYADGTIDPDIEKHLRRLKIQHEGKANLLKEIVYEPEPEAAYRANLQRIAPITRNMAEQVLAIIGILADAKDDSMRFMMKEEFGRLADRLHDASGAFRYGADSTEYAVGLEALEAADDALEEAFERIRKKSLTYDYPTKEVLRFTSILYLTRAVVQDFKELRAVDEQGD